MKLKGLSLGYPSGGRARRRQHASQVSLELYDDGKGCQPAGHTSVMRGAVAYPLNSKGIRAGVTPLARMLHAPGDHDPNMGRPAA